MLASESSFSSRIESLSSRGISGPEVQFATPIFDFGKIRQDEIVRHDFVFTNTGSSTLVITAVSPGCGCTTAENWDKQVAPGKQGLIRLEFKSAGFRGMVTKTATVTSNDPNHPIVELQLKGTVWKPFEIEPAMALFAVSSETDVSETKVIRIVSQLEEPVALNSVEGVSPPFRVELKTVKAGKEFELYVTCDPPFLTPSKPSLISVKTSSLAEPFIQVNAHVLLQQSVVVQPGKINLPSMPLNEATSAAVIIRNNGVKPLQLLDAAIIGSRAEVVLQELQPGKLYRVAVAFPRGFVVTAGADVELSIKTDHPKFATIRVPVVAADSNSRGGSTKDAGPTEGIAGKK